MSSKDSAGTMKRLFFFALHQIFVGHDTHHVNGKAVNGDAVVDDIIPHFPAKTGIFGNQLLDVLEALCVFGVPLDRTDAVSFVIMGICKIR